MALPQDRQCTNNPQVRPPAHAICTAASAQSGHLSVHSRRPSATTTSSPICSSSFITQPTRATLAARRRPATLGLWSSSAGLKTAHTGLPNSMARSPSCVSQQQQVCAQPGGINLSDSSIDLNHSSRDGRINSNSNSNSNSNAIHPLAQNIPTCEEELERISFILTNPATLLDTTRTAPVSTHPLAAWYQPLCNGHDGLGHKGFYLTLRTLLDRLAHSDLCLQLTCERDRRMQALHHPQVHHQGM